MSVASLTFSLPDEEYEYSCAVDGAKYRAVLEELDRHLRDKLKYEKLKPQARTALQDTRDLLWDLVSSHDVTLV